LTGPKTREQEAKRNQSDPRYKILDVNVATLDDAGCPKAVPSFGPATFSFCHFGIKPEICIHNKLKKRTVAPTFLST